MKSLAIQIAGAVLGMSEFKDVGPRVPKNVVRGVRYEPKHINHSKYVPHQGAKEKARRVRQGLAA